MHSPLGQSLFVLPRIEAGIGGHQPRQPAQPPLVFFQCFLTGHQVVLARTLGKLKGIDPRAGGVTAGKALISFDEESSWSYGLKQSFNAAMSEQAGRVIESGLNNLLSRPESAHELAGVQVIHWFKQLLPKADDVLDFLFDPTREEHSAQRRARELLDAIRTGKRADLGSNEFYVVLLSGRRPLRIW